MKDISSTDVDNSSPSSPTTTIDVAKLFPMAKKTGEKAMLAEKTTSDITALPNDIRWVCRQWPRAPNGKTITSHFHGKRAPNGVELWGSTIFDFYYVNIVPKCAPIVSTGSRLMKWMKATGEVDYARDLIEQAEMEEDPKMIEPWSPRAQIMEMEKNIRQGKAGKSMPKDLKGEKASTGSLFDPANYPALWPLVPFSYDTERLTSTIDLDHLPKRLVVHDPWNLLAVDSSNAFGPKKAYNGEEWTSMKDNTCVYKLEFSNHGIERAKSQAEERARANEKVTQSNEPMDDPHIELVPGDEEDALEGLGGFIINEPTTPGRTEPPVMAIPRPRPCTDTPASKVSVPIEEAHLYLSPKHIIGMGNHSFVYQAELELPRAAIIPTPPKKYVMCKKCVDADIARIVREIDGEHGERKDPKWTEKSGDVIIIGEDVSVVARLLAHIKADNRDEFDVGKRIWRTEYVGPVRRIRTTMEWQDPMNPTCSHFERPEGPPTVKMRVIGKLSLKDDDQLVQEASNYETFEKHMFEHWSGLNLIKPLRNPFSVGALVPQFYGYYVPDSKTHSKDEGFLSPILLLEDCGSPIDIQELNEDQKNEAQSLMCRFHHAGWIHGSFYPRNILIQPGPISLPPSERSNENAIFRLIDFGRSFQYEKDSQTQWDSDNKRHEMSRAERLFNLGCFY